MPVIRFHHVNLVVRGKPVLKGISWTIEPRQNWLVMGPNGAGKTSLFKIILGHIYYRGDLFMETGLRENLAYVSFDRQSALARRESQKDHARHFSGKFQEGMVTAETLLRASIGYGPVASKMDEVCSLLDIHSLLKREIRQLSTGEMRKVLIAEALITSPQLLILDEPFDGLDQTSAALLGRLIEKLMADKIQVLLATHRFEEIPASITHVLCMKQGAIHRQGEKEKVFEPGLIRELYGDSHKPETFLEIPFFRKHDRTAVPAENLIRMVNVTVKYGSKVVLSGGDWQVNKGENWLISGPNGAGKSTLLSLITADHPQAYANEIYLFGTRRGSGESIWDIKQKIGLVSAEFHIRHTMPAAPVTGFQVVLSGFFDSVGLYRYADESQRRTAMQWLEDLGLEAYASQTYTHLSYGEQRMLLIARAMVKSPALLVLDEPFQGVDFANRRLLIGLIDHIGNTTDTVILYVTHRQEELTCITHILKFQPDGAGGHGLLTEIVN